MRPNHPPAALLLALALSPLSLGGCGDDGRPPRYPATGRVLVDGEPAGGVQVRLVPADRPGDPDALQPRATTGPDGTFALGTFEESDGAPAGRYRATLFWPDRPPGPSRPEDRLAGRYAAPEGSPFEVEIGQGENPIPPFEAERPDAPRRPSRRQGPADVDGMAPPPEP